MSDLTLDEKTTYARHRAAEQAAEEHFWDLNQPFFPLGFSVDYRNPGHWDVYARRCPGKVAAYNHVNPQGFTSGRDTDRERAFRIRGEAGKVLVMDERWNPRRERGGPSLVFRSVLAAMLYIVEELMQEPSA